MALSDLNFNQDLAFEAAVRKDFGCPVNFVSGHGLHEFFLVVDFSRSKLRLNLDSVGLILQSCFGGIAARFKVLCSQNGSVGDIQNRGIIDMYYTRVARWW